MKLKLREKKVNVFGKSIPAIAVIAMVLMAGIAGAALVDYLSNTITTRATVSSPIELLGTMTYWPASGGWLQTGGEASAEWATEEKYNGDYSVHLKTNDEDEELGDEASVVVIMPEGFTLGDLQTLSWWRQTDVGYPPHVDIILDDDIDGIENIDSITAEMAVNNKETLGILGIAADLPEGWVRTFELVADDGYGVIDDTTTFWVTRHGAGTADAPYGTLADLKAGTVTNLYEDPEITISSSTVILRMEFEVDNWIVETDTYVDDITINDVLYDLEPDSYALVGESPSPVQLRGGDEFYVDLEATNLANTPIKAVYSCSVSGTDIGTEDITFESVDGTVWTDPAIEDGTLTATTVTPTTINPMGTSVIYFRVTANPALDPDLYTFGVRLKAVPPS